MIDLYSVKPIDIDTLVAAADATGGRIVVAEDHHPEGGVGSAVADALLEAKIGRLRLAHLSVSALLGSCTTTELLIDAVPIATAAAALVAGEERGAPACNVPRSVGPRRTDGWLAGGRRFDPDRTDPASRCGGRDAYAARLPWPRLPGTRPRARHAGTRTRSSDRPSRLTRRRRHLDSSYRWDDHRTLRRHPGVIAS